MESYRAIIMVAGCSLGSALAAKFVGQNWKETTIVLDEHQRVNGIDCVKHRVRAQGSDS
jgi:hypothetical protein